MKLFLTWLLGVPLLVAAMVVTRAMTPQGLEARAKVAASPCLRQAHIQLVDSPIIGNRHRVTCHRRAVER